MKISVSGWPGTGGSTFALLLAKTLNLKYFSVGEVFRTLGKKLNYAETGIDRVLADKYLEEDFGKSFDSYILSKINSPEFDNVLIEGDVTGFLASGNKELFSIFLLSDQSERLKRVVIDGRQADKSVLDKRDAENKEFYKKLYNINWFDVEEIEDKHNLVIDNSNLSIGAELKLAYEALLKDELIDQPQAQDLTVKADSEDAFYWAKGKQWYIDYLQEQGLFIGPEEILKEMSTFSEFTANLPSDLRKVLESHK